MDDMWMVDSVMNSKIPDHLGVIEKARANYLARMDALALGMEEEILALAGQLKVLCLQIARDQSFSEEQDTFDDMWFELNDVFQKFCNHCDGLDIHIYDVCCLTLTDDEVLSSNDEDDETSSSDDKDEEMSD